MFKADTWRISVVIPAQNEESTVARCVESVRLAHRSLTIDASLWIVVVADSCTDRTAEAAKRALRNDGEVIDCAVRSAGMARGLGVAASLEHFTAAAPERVWIANTDADSHVPWDWLQRQLDFADEGDVGVAGIVELEREPDCNLVHKIFGRTYSMSDDGTHTHVHGANIGVRADAYLSVGGWSSLGLAEDHCLWNRLKAAGWQLRSTTKSRVTTSARLHGRAAGGFADTLRAHVEQARA